jgi:hypothetical protein
MKRTITYTRTALISTKQFENTRVELTDSIELDLTHWGNGDDVRDDLIQKVDLLVARKVLEAKGLLQNPQVDAQRLTQEKTRRRNQAKAALRESGFSSTTDEFVDRIIYGSE